MTNWRKMAFVALFAASISGLKAQETVTLKQAIEYALQNKAEALKAKLDVRNSDYQIMEAKSNALPQISGVANLTYNPLLQKSALDVGAFSGGPSNIQLISFGQKWNAGAGLQLSQAVFNQKVFIGLKAAKSTKEFYQLNAQLTEEQIIERVSNAYFEVFTIQQKRETLESSFTSTEKARNVIKSLFDNGLAKKVDLDRTNVNLTNISTILTQQQNGINQAENALKFYMGMPIETEIELVRADMEITRHLLDNTAATDSRTEVQLLSKQSRSVEGKTGCSEFRLPDNGSEIQCIASNFRGCQSYL